MIYGRWDEHGGCIWCPRCYSPEEFDPECELCSGGGQLELQGEATDNIEGEVPYCAYREAALLSIALFHNNFPQSIIQWVAQPAKAIAAYRFLLPFIHEEVKAEERQQQRELTLGRDQT